MRAPTTVIFVVAVLLVLIPAAAWAQSSQTAEANDALIANGVALRKEGRDIEALAVFRRAYAVHPSPRALAQIALANQALAHWPDAEQGLMDAMRASDDEWITRNRAYLEQSLSAVQAHLASLEVESNVAGAEFYVAGELLGRLPLDHPLRVSEGDVTLEVRAAGYSPLVRTLHVEAKSQVHAAFTFALPAAPSANQSSKTTAVEHPSARGGAPSVRTWGLVTFAAAAGLALVGVAGVVTREVEAHIYNDDSQCGPLAGQSRADRCGTHRDIGMAAQTVAIGAFAGAGAAGAVSGLLLLRNPRPAPGQVSCTVAGSGLACGAAF
jgi:PEGA domain